MNPPVEDGHFRCHFLFLDKNYTYLRAFNMRGVYHESGASRSIFETFSTN